MKNKITLFTMVAILIAMSFAGCGESTTQTVTGMDGKEFAIDVSAVKAYKGYGESDENGKIKPLDKNDVRASAIADTAAAFVSAADNKDYRTVVGDEGYEFLTQEVIDDLNAQDDISQTKLAYELTEKITEVSNLEVKTVVIFPDGGAHAEVVYDCTLKNTTDPEIERTYGYQTGEIGDVKQVTASMDFSVDKNGGYKICAFQFY